MILNRCVSKHLLENWKKIQVGELPFFGYGSFSARFVPPGRAPVSQLGTGLGGSVLGNSRIMSAAGERFCKNIPYVGQIFVCQLPRNWWGL